MAIFLMTGTGGAGSGIYNSGIVLFGIGTISSTGTGVSAGNITLSGTGGSVGRE